MPLKRAFRPRFGLAFAALVLLVSWQAARAVDTPRRNVLFLISDDLNTLLACYGDPQAKTPNLDKLAARAVRFDRAYCAYPLCGPSRNAMLTGLYPNSTGIFGNSQIFRETIPEHVSLPQAFRHEGYLAVRIGKLYHYAVPNGIGTSGHDDPASWEIQFNPIGVDNLEERAKIFSLTPGQFGATLSWLASSKPDAAHTDGEIAADAEWVLKRCAEQRNRPFFLATGFFRPHTPYVAPKAYYDLYAKADMRVVTGVKEDQADLPPAALASYKREQDRLTDDLRREALQGYYACISFMDAQVGRVIDTLDRLKLTDNTVVVFTSDHGYHTGEHGLWQKQSLFEESNRVPFMIMAPGVKAGVVKTPVSLVDLYPTLTELCGVKAPANLQGQSLVPMLKDNATVGRGWALSQVSRGAGAAGGDGESGNAKGGKKGKAGGKAKAAEPTGRFMGYTLRTARWRYTEWGEGKFGRELYDHDVDPKEITNLAILPQHAATVDELSRQLHAAVKSTLPPSGEPPARNAGAWFPVFDARNAR